MNSKKIVLKSLVVICGLSFAQAQEKSVTISGRIDGIGNQEIRLVDPVKGEVAKVAAVQDSFLFNANINVSDQRFYTLHVPSLGDLGPSMKRPAIFFIAGADPIQIHAAITDGSLRDEKISGSKGMDDFNNSQKSLVTNQAIEVVGKSYNDAFHAYNTVSQTEENLKVLKEEGRKLDSCYGLQREEIMQKVAANRSSLTWATLASQYCPPESNKEGLTKFLSLFSDEVRKESYYLQNFETHLKRYNQTDVGQVAPNFELIQLDGKTVALDSFKGKYVLLDFWASWCGPCRREMPHVKAAYHQFKDKKFEVFAVSIDSSKPAWEKALKEDNMPFVHVLDNKQGEDSPRLLYMVQAIPTNFLIDPSGKIIAKNLRGEELAKFLEATL
ncbi:TlpA family protein disulfide reductase [Sphingobacterium tabacisoli]|uniref:TlpA family protein disulfide reductase n=1 Tax=Sphingobacterium tabacisoli TaxID=2044855 RepID=A0ABW5L874_9SPHI|nr:TlpA disulfide reductase family protein [Sphingobacterium tabacisoli]